ncbi:MAG: hypothetical protein R2695_03595 [Acidimicrobiales bacterium]
MSLVGKASSSKKVQRAARAAASSRGTGERKERGFPLLMALVVLLGIGLVVAARSSRETLIPPFVGENLEDGHWHSALDVYDCGTIQPAVVNTLNDPDGIHTHGDSLIHVHPFNSSASGKSARFGVFFDAIGMKVTTDSISDPAFPTIQNDGGCAGADSEIVIGRWALGGDDGPELVNIYKKDFADIRFLDDGEAFTVAKVPVGEDPPAPSETSLAQLAAATGSTNIEATTVPATVAPGDTTAPGTSTAPGDTTAPGTSTAPGDTAVPATTDPVPPATTVPAPATTAG